MDVADARFNATQGRDRDELALQVQYVFKKFLEEDRDRGGQLADEALELLANERNSLFINFKQIEIFDSNLAEDIIGDYYRFYPYLCRALATFVREERIRQAESLMDPNAGAVERLAEREQLKKELDKPLIRNKDFYVGFYNLAVRDNIRELTSVKVGTLTRVTGQVVRTHSSHPELIIGCFRCKDCLSEQYAEQQFRYTQPTICTNQNCSNRVRFDLVLDKSRFTDFQRIRIQETQQELPRGCIPRSFDVIIRGADQVECIQPGDMCDFVGTLIAVPDVGQIMSGTFGTVSGDMGGEGGVTGLRSLGVKEMTYNLAFLANACILEGQNKPIFNSEAWEPVEGQGLEATDFSKEEIERIQRMSQDPKLLDNLSQSLFSSVYGSDDVKRGLLLQLLGGVAKRTSTGTKLRGDINICLVGDPSTAKSQFLKIVTDFAPVKAVYASGKASSASGLTAAVVRDTDGGFVIEAGALMLADRGICCIDEFDKMDLKDQVAIHEAMEQQTISITKAGVSATLNARASILAAANPIGGSYNQRRDLRANVNLSLAIMSRFDLFFVLIDPHSAENDHAVAVKILDMHRTCADPRANEKDMIYSFEDIKLYIRFARKYHPKISPEAEQIFVKEYIRLRNRSKEAPRSWSITVRQLESLIRLSEAIARAHCAETVIPNHVLMAARLIQTTNVQVGKDEVELNDFDPTNKMDVDIDDCVGETNPTHTATGTQSMYLGELESQRLDSTQQLGTGQQSLKIPVATYKGMTGVFIDRFSGLDDQELPALKRSELIEWYLRQCVGEIESESELIRRKELCDKVLDRLILREHILVEIKEDGQVIDPSQQVRESDQEIEDRLVIINPNFNPEEFYEQVEN